jgi:ribosome maturation factor RimP
MSRASDRTALLRLLEPVAAELGMDLEDVDVTPAGKRRLLRVVVDRDGGVQLDQVAQVSTAVSAALDDSDAMGGSPYVLEVTSPGVDRPLTQPRHWRRARARLVDATLQDGSTVTGRVLDAGEDGLLLEVGATQRRLDWVDVSSGRVQVEFTRATGQTEE